MRCFARRINEKCPSQNPQTRTNLDRQLLTVPRGVGEGVPGGGLVDEAGMLALARLVFLPLSSERRSSFLLRLAFVMPTAKPLEVHRAVIVTRLDVIAVCACSGASRPVMQERFAPAACTGADEGAALAPVRREPRRTIAR
nr:MAG TPA: hypothetical protein [Caudoviricetes sp.]